MPETVRTAWPRAHRARVLGAARPRPARWRADHRLRARGGGPRRARPAVPGLPPGRARVRGPAPDEGPDRALLARPGAVRVPRPHARPARHGPLDAGRRPAREDARGAGGPPAPLPRRLDRARRGVDPPRARRRPLERPGAELRRVLRPHLPLVRSRRPARGVLHRRPAADRPARRRRLPRHLRAGARPEPPVLRPLPGGSRTRPRAPPPHRCRRRPAAREAIASRGAASARSATCSG